MYALTKKDYAEINAALYDIAEDAAVDTGRNDENYNTYEDVEVELENGDCAFLKVRSFSSNSYHYSHDWYEPDESETSVELTVEDFTGYNKETEEPYELIIDSEQISTEYVF